MMPSDDLPNNDKATILFLRGVISEAITYIKRNSVEAYCQTAKAIETGNLRMVFTGDEEKLLDILKRADAVGPPPDTEERRNKIKRVKELWDRGTWDQIMYEDFWVVVYEWANEIAKLLEELSK